MEAGTLMRERWRSFRDQPVWAQYLLAVIYLVGAAFAAFALYAVVVITFFGI